MRTSSHAILLLVTLLTTACSENGVEPALVLTDVSVIDVKTGDVAEGQTAIIRDDRIEFVGAAPPADAMSTATIHDHTGHYVIPGLWEMHVHIRNSFDAELVEENAAWLRQYPGFGVTAVRDAGGDLHHELEALVDAGLTPLQALQGATLHAVNWLGEADDFGTIEAGKVADLVILEANPLDTIENTRSLVAVIQGGSYLDGAALTELRTLRR